MSKLTIEIEDGAIDVIKGVVTVFDGESIADKTNLVIAVGALVLGAITESGMEVEKDDPWRTPYNDAHTHLHEAAKSIAHHIAPHIDTEGVVYSAEVQFSGILKQFIQAQVREYLKTRREERVHEEANNG